jgi:hypothetical protein
MPHPVVVGAGVLVALLLVAELVAVPVATRLVGRALDRCATYGSLTIEEVARPVVPRLLVGRARDVVLHVEDGELEGIRVAEARIEAPHVVLPWALGDPTPGPATVHLRVDEDAVADRLGDLAPLGVRPDVRLDDGVARVGVPSLRLEVSLTLAVRDDGVLVLQPGSGPPGWWQRLGLSREIALPAGASVGAVTLDDRELRATVHLDELPGADGEGCDGPVAADPPVLDPGAIDPAVADASAADRVEAEPSPDRDRLA